VKDFTASAGRLRALSVGAKILYTAFTISAMVGLIVSWRLYGAVIGDGGAASYYAGAPSAPTPSAESPPGDDEGPKVDLPDEARTPRVMTEEVSERKLLEVTHFHLFSVPVYVLILAHLWLLVRMPGWLQSSGVLASVATSGLHLAAPWIVRGRPALTPLVPTSGAAMLVTLGAVALVPTVDMWLPKSVRRSAARPDGPET
jgi:hypothetical protein